MPRGFEPFKRLGYVPRPVKQIVRFALVGTAVGAIGLAACDDAAPPPKVAVSQSVAPEAIAASDTIVAVVRKALSEAVRDRDPYSRARRLGTLLPTLGPEAVPAAKQTLEDRKVDLKATDIDLLVRYWATHQPEEASRWSVTQSPINYRAVAVFSALSAWAQADPQAAVRVGWPWADIPTLESIVPIALVRGWYAANDPPALRKFLRDSPPDILSQRALAAYIRVVIETEGIAAVERWAESLPDGDDDKSYKVTVFSRVVDALSLLDVEAAVAWCNLHCDGPYGANMRSLIGRNWVLHDGPAALAWLSTARPGTERDLAVRLTFQLWTRTDREATLAWLADQTKTGEAAPWLRPVYPIYARLLSGDRPLDAIQWAERIENDQQREHVLIGVLRVWRHSDEAAAEAWMLQSSLSEGAREKVRSPVQEPLQANE